MRLFRDDGHQRIHVVTCFLMRRGRLLILRRSEKVGTYRCRWAGVSGYIEKGERPVGAAIKEVREETGLAAPGIVLIRKGPALPIAFTNFVVHPFLFEVKKGRVRLDWEHSESRWIRPSELGRFGTVPGLADALRSVLLEPHPRGEPGNRGAREPVGGPEKRQPGESNFRHP
jgi:8-oxo-dGTP diphosphatase